MMLKFKWQYILELLKSLMHGHNIHHIVTDVGAELAILWTDGLLSYYLSIPIIHVPSATNLGSIITVDFFFIVASLLHTGTELAKLCVQMNLNLSYLTIYPVYVIILCNICHHDCIYSVRALLLHNSHYSYSAWSVLVPGFCQHPMKFQWQKIFVILLSLCKIFLAFTRVKYL